ncbi:hypothetical protein C7N43_02960 [Sphingobacteriales bacterium UPWRP_1]|nr:hypothetical protein BVG80_09465 [Sphingobacteriales bacterium TSM_CSM]PSJ78578.1 hypothetical protein C7N43_02960 [Sphingobacteriales bacterium UPWRP_1]
MEPLLYEHLHGFVYNCNTCLTRCDAKSKLQYHFGADAAFSERFENYLINRINQNTALPFTAQKTTQPGYPDIALYQKTTGNNCIAFIEVKVQTRTFMTIQNHLPQANLYPSETIALNQSDLLRYFTIKEQTQLPLFIAWALLNRPCVLKTEKVQYYHQEADLLQQIFRHYQNLRRFRRQSGQGDVVEGQHKGVVVNYHFSLSELVPGLPLGL